MMDKLIKTAAERLLEGRFDDCHQIVQQHEIPDGNYLHAVLHRVEKDYGNSLYWYRRASGHPVVGEMGRRYPGWAPEMLVRLCESDPQSHEAREQEQAELEAIRKHYLAV